MAFEIPLVDPVTVAEVARCMSSHLELFLFSFGSLARVRIQWTILG